jgi:hypothetical protein
VGSREQAIADGVCDGRFAQTLVPQGDRELARDHPALIRGGENPLEAGVKPAS